MNFHLTHPDKIIYPANKITKLDIAVYYDKIQEWILPYVINRPLTLLRCPEGEGKTCFYQKHLQLVPKGLHTVNIQEKKGSAEKYLFIKDVEGLLRLVQMGVLEIHPWGSRQDHYNHPDIIVFDLDPAPTVPWKKVVEAAFLIRDELKKLNLCSFVKSTGGKGLHVVLPILPQFEWKQVKNFTKVFVEYLVKQSPGDYVSTLKKSARAGKIFIDYLRNQQGATSIVPYSTRANPNATVAAPLAWDELSNRKADNTFSIKTLPKRLSSLKKDPWETFFQIKQSLKKI